VGDIIMGIGLRISGQDHWPLGSNVNFLT